MVVDGSAKVFIGQLGMSFVQVFYAVLSQIVLEVVHISFTYKGDSWTSRHRFWNILDLLLQIYVKIWLRFFFHNRPRSFRVGLLIYKRSQIKIFLRLSCFGTSRIWIRMLKCGIILFKNRRHLNSIELLLPWRVVPICLSLFLNLYLVVDALHINLRDLL